MAEVGVLSEYIKHLTTHLPIEDGVSRLTNIGSDNGLAPTRRQAIIWTNTGLLLNGPLGTYFSEIWNKIQQFSLKKINLKMSSGKCRPSCLGLNVLTAGTPGREIRCWSVLCRWLPFKLLTWFNFNPSMDKWLTHYTVWDEIAYLVPNLNGCTRYVRYVCTSWG